MLALVIFRLILRTQHFWLEFLLWSLFQPAPLIWGWNAHCIEFAHPYWAILACLISQFVTKPLCVPNYPRHVKITHMEAWFPSPPRTLIQSHFAFKDDMEEYYNCVHSLGELARAIDSQFGFRLESLICVQSGNGGQRAKNSFAAWNTKCNVCRRIRWLAAQVQIYASCPNPHFLDCRFMLSYERDWDRQVNNITVTV